jgi:hypothetical protein
MLPKLVLCYIPKSIINSQRTEIHFFY